MKFDKRAQCDGKGAYQTPQMAYRVAAKSRRFNAKPYRCEYCGKFHISGVEIGLT